MKPNTRPRRGLGVAVFLIGCVIALGLVVLGVSSVARRADALAELPLSGGTIPSDVRGDVTIFARVDGSPTSMAPPMVQAAVVDEDGNGLQLKTYTSINSFSIGDKSGIAEWSVSIPSDGEYRLVGQSADENVTGWLVGKSPVSASGFVGPILGGVAVGFLGLIFGLLIFFGAMFRKKLDPSSAGYVPGPPQPGQYPQQPQLQVPQPGQYPQQAQSPIPPPVAAQPVEPEQQLPPPPPPMPPYPTAD